MDNFDLRKFLSEGKLHEAMSAQDTEDIAGMVADEFTKESADEGEYLRYSVGRVEGTGFELDTEATDMSSEDLDMRGVGEGWGGNFSVEATEDGHEVRNAEKGGLVATIDSMGNFTMLSADESRAEMGSQDDIPAIDRMYNSDAWVQAQRDAMEETKSTKMKKGVDLEIVRYMADSFIQNAKDGDPTYADFLDLNIRDAVHDVIEILNTRNHKLHNTVKGEYNAVKADKAKGMFESQQPPASTKMKKSELKEMIKAAMLAEAEGDEEEDIELEDEADVEVDADVDVDMDMDAGEGGIDVKQDADSDLSGTVGDVQDNLEAALEAARKLGDEKLEDQIGNTLTFFTRSHVVKEGNKMDLEESASSDLELKSYAKKLIPLIKQLGFDVVYSTDGEWKKNLGDLKPGAEIVYISIEKGDLIISIPKSAGLSKAQEILKKVNSDLGNEFDAKISEGKIGQTSLYMIKMTLK